MCVVQLSQLPESTAMTGMSVREMSDEEEEEDTSEKEDILLIIDSRNAHP